MDTEDRIKPEQNLEDAPFMVIYNYRHNLAHPPKPRLPKPLKQPSPQMHSIILTRKMAAEIEMKNQQESKEYPPCQHEPEARVEKEQSEWEKDFFTAGQLEKGIPMQDKDDGDILYNINSMSLSQNYSKLQKILFGFTFNDIVEEPLEEKVA